MFYTGLTHWGPVTHIYIGNLIIIDSDNGLLPGRCQAIIWTNAGILLIGPLGTNCSEIWIEILTFSFKKINVFESVVCEIAAILSQPQCVKTECSLNILTCKKHELATSYPNVTNILSLWARENIFSWIWNCYSEHKIKYEYDVIHNVMYVLSEFLGIRYPLYLSWCL